MRTQWLMCLQNRGFNDWSRFQCNISEQLFVDTADAMASNGMLKAGYNREYFRDLGAGLFWKLLTLSQASISMTAGQVEDPTMVP